MNPPPNEPLTPARTTAFGRRKQKDHALKGEWIGYRECHLADDWLLVYRIVGNEICFARTGTHTDMFEA